MLIVTITNDKSGTLTSRNYEYGVYVNKNKIAQGRVEGHDPKDGWKGLVKQLAEESDYAEDYYGTDERLLELLGIIEELKR